MKAARGFLRPCFAVSGVVAALAAVVGWFTAAGAGAWAAPTGVALAALGFAGSVTAVAYAEKIDLRLTLPMALITYTVKLAAALTALAVVKSTVPDALLPFACGVIVGAVAWLAAQVVWAYKAKIPYIELRDGS